MKIIHFNKDDFQEVQNIYRDGLATGLATFETEVPDWNSWDNAHLDFGRIAVIENEKMLGWASLSGVSSRCVYGGVAEVSVYVAEDSRGKGVGKILLNELIAESESNNIWTLQAGIFPENIGSKILHEKCGFRLVGYREKIGKLNGVWKDNLILERRSTVVGV